MCEHLTEVECHSNKVVFFNVKTNHLIASAMLGTDGEIHNFFSSPNIIR
jgi:hypothetical protein